VTDPVSAVRDGDGALSLLSRPAGYLVIRECLAHQEQAVPRNTVKRILGFRPLHPDAKSWFTGALGEINVGRFLEQLGPEWTVFHAVPVGKGESDIDHVLVGPPGVFTVNTKHHAGARVWVGSRALLVAGQKTSYLRNSHHEADRASTLLSLATGTAVTAHAILVMVDPASLTVKQRPDDVTVLTAKQLVRWLERHKRVLSDESVAQLAEAAADPRTWHKTADASVDPSYLQAFSALREKVERARVLRMGWAVLGTVLFVVWSLQYLPAMVRGLLL
jgi:hypothetical protein